MDEAQVNLSLVWPGIDDVSVDHINQVLAQVSIQQPIDPNTPTVDEVILSFGYVTPPVMLGTPQEQNLMAQALSAVPVHSISRFSLTRHSFLSILKAFEDVRAQILKIEGGAQ